MTTQRKSGFTLIEILLTITFLFIGLLALLQIFPLAFGLERINQIRTQAVLLAQEKMETVNSQGYQAALTGDVFEPNLPSPFEFFSRRTIISYVDGNLEEALADLGLKKIEVVVSWQSALPLVPKEFRIISLMVAK